MKFNIANRLDIDALNSRIYSYDQETWGDFYIFMSPDTLAHMSPIDDYYKSIGKSTNNNCTGRVGSYFGHKVFSDPSMKYGDVEFR